MSEIHLGKKDGTQTQHSEDELHTMRNSGTLDPTWLFWRAGMPEWRPVSEWIAENPPPTRAFLAEADDHGTEDSGPKSYQLQKDPGILSRVLIALLIVVAFTNLLDFMLALWEYRILRIPANLRVAATAAHTLASFALALASLATMIPTLICFCIWIYRTKFNACGFADGLKITPGWAVGWYFIPFFNIIRPWQSMCEAWQASSDPRNWRKARVSPIVHWWWGAWTFCNVIGFVGAQVTLRAAELSQKGEDFQPMMVIANYVHMAGSIGGMAVCVLAILLVRGLTRAQFDLVESQVEPGQNLNTVSSIPR